MRLLPDAQRNELLAQVCSYATLHTQFQIAGCESNFQVIPGETEGLYGWLAANYLLGGFDSPNNHEHGKGHHTYGFLEMGGASAQIAFAPNATESERHAEDLKLMRLRTIDGAAAEHKIFVTTWLGYGANEARRRYVEGLLEDSGETNGTELEDPCLPVDLTISTKGDVLLPDSKTIHGETPTLIGTGRFDECLKRTYPLLDKDAPCEDEPCLLHGVHVPAIDFDVNHFVGVSEYWHTTHEVFEMGHKDKAYDFNTYQQRVRKFCSDDWKHISEGIAKHTWGKKVDEKTAVEVCFKASWLINLLHEGIGIPRAGLEETPSDLGYNGTKEVLHNAKAKGFTDSFQAVDKIQDTEVSWTLGKMLLYASSQIPPLEPSLPVGFGNNTRDGSLPPNFQYAAPPPSSSPAAAAHNKTTPTETPPPPGAADPEPDTHTWHSTLLAPSSPRRIPGLLLILLIFLLVLFLLRHRLYHKLGLGSTPLPTPPFRRRHKPPGAKSKLASLFRASGGGYERVLEEGGSEFELEGADVGEEEGEGSDSSGQSLGLGIRGGLVGGGGGGGWGGGTVGEGLVSRTESRERLVGLEGRRSGRGSPTRGGRLGRLVED